MPAFTHFNDSINWHVAELTARVVAETGIPSDRFHLGKILLQSFKDHPELVLQIDAATGQSETNGEALRRVIKCALGLKTLGVQKGDVMVLMAPTHLDLAIPFYAALCLGMPIASIDMMLGVAELKDTFDIAQPKVVFCQSNKVSDVLEALKKASCEAEVVTFDKSDQSDQRNFNDLLDQSCDEDAIRAYRPSDFDPSETLAAVIATSGTTGSPKLAAVTHKNFVIAGPYYWCRYTEFPPFNAAMVVAPLQWLSAIIVYICAPFLKFTRLQSSQTLTREHIYDIINTYKPEFTLLSPTLMTTLLKPGARDVCDFTCFKNIYLGGSAVHQDLISEIKKVSPNTDAVNLYGMSEMTGVAFAHGHSSPPNACGKPIGGFQYRLVDYNTRKQVFDPYVNGELWVKGPAIFKGYYNKPEVTREVFEDGWFKTGDILYRDEAWNFFFVERIKLLLKYRNHQISPVEVEAVILQHPRVLDVVVTGIPDQECGELPVACVVPSTEHPPTAQEIKDLVKASLTDTKQLRGGVVFMNQLPMTASTKIHRTKIREMVLNMPRE